MESFGERVPVGTPGCWMESVASGGGAGLAGVCATAGKMRQRDASRYLIMGYHYKRVGLESDASTI